ncbi:conserved phage C-terminal domain-containing protein [Clostridium nigeriense]|uniref:conserved phage C-terminal domain-containing protein n=1 Tax=Clostridium nigeriense TaxID=1805470 RepID=UPI003D33CB6B
MQFSFLGYSVKKIMEFNLDVKDVTILRYFDDFRNSGKMNYEVIEGVKYYWISYQNIENELPFLGLGKRTIMMRMLKLRDLGILSHYTKKEGGTFSFYAFGKKYKELLYINKDNDAKDNDKDNNKDNKGKVNNGNREQTNNYYIDEEDIDSNGILEGDSTINEVLNNEDSVRENDEARHDLENLSVNNHQNEEGVSQNNHRGYAEKCSTKTHLLNNSSTIVTNIYNNIKDNVSSIINYLNLKVGVMYKPSNTKTISLIKTRLREGFSFDDFKKVIDKKVKVWKGTSFEQYLTPFTLFGDKFEVYLNQKIVKQEKGKNNNPYENKKGYGTNKNLRFHNFKGRDYDYDDLEKKLLGWD